MHPRRAPFWIEQSFASREMHKIEVMETSTFPSLFINHEEKVSAEPLQRRVAALASSAARDPIHTVQTADEMRGNWPC
jgi:hypothetical protein